MRDEVGQADVVCAIRVTQQFSDTDQHVLRRALNFMNA